MAMPPPPDGRSIVGGIVSSVPSTVWMLIATQFAALVFWGIRINNKVHDNEKQIQQMAREDTAPGQVLKGRVDVIEERLRYAINYVLFLREEMTRIAPPGRPAPPIFPTNPPGQTQLPPRGHPTDPVTPLPSPTVPTPDETEGK